MLKKSALVVGNFLLLVIKKILQAIWFIVVPGSLALQEPVHHQTQNQELQPNLLLIKADNEEIAIKYQNHTHFHPGDSGYDLFAPGDVAFKPYETKFVNFKITCEMLHPLGHNVSYYLYARSSISKTPLILHNHVGVIDAGYRGNIIAALRFIPGRVLTPEELESEEFNTQEKRDKAFVYSSQEEQDSAIYKLEKGTRIAQICSGDLTPLNTQLVDKLSETKRGSGGFGSTGK
jgi:dUTP diphosphatase